MATTKRVVVLVKAYPQPSQTYGETVCCAGITDAGELVRLFPIRFRRLKPEARFDRFDTIEVKGDRPRDDHRPESFHVDEDSIRVVHRGSSLKPEDKVRIWLPRVSPTLEELHQANRANNVSLGIVRPDPDSVKFSWESAASLAGEDREISKSLYEQTSLIEDPLKKLTPPAYAFEYSYTSAGKKSRGKIHDWEVQATYMAYKRRYGAGALEKMKEQYETEMPRHNLHVLLGTMMKHPRNFIIIGLLRSSADVDAIGAQASLI